MIRINIHQTFSSLLAQAFHTLMRMVICCGNFLSVARSNSWPSLMRIVARGSQLPLDPPQITTAGIWPTVCLPPPLLLFFFPCFYSLILNRIRIILIPSLLLHTSLVSPLSLLDIQSLLPPVFLPLFSTFPHLYKGPGNISLPQAN